VREKGSVHEFWNIQRWEEITPFFMSWPLSGMEDLLSKTTCGESGAGADTLGGSEGKFLEVAGRWLKCNFE
jgi:hypothetical protein